MAKTAVITGASRGIGKQIAVKLSKEGYNLVVNYRNQGPELDALIKEVQANGAKVYPFQGDISNFETAKSMMDFAIHKTGSIDLLVNNAGITKDKLLARMSEDDFDQVVQVNLKGTFNCIRHAGRVMMKQKYGKIISMASVIALIGNVGQANYAASKAGIIGLTKSAAKELAPYNVTVNAIAPGYIDTDMTRILPEEAKEAILKTVPMGKPGGPEDVANVVRFLASSDADYITGQVIHVDGGMVMS